MPRLGSLLVCEKIIQDHLGKPTLVSLFQKLGAVVPEGQEMPKQAMAGISWSVFTEWFFTDEELNRTPYYQVLEVVLPDGSPSPIRGRVELKQLAKDGLASRCFISMVGMPISKVGFLSIRVWIERGSERITDVGSYPIQIEHTKQLPTPDDGATFAFRFFWKVGEGASS